MKYTQLAIKRAVLGGLEVWETNLGENSTCVVCEKQLCWCDIERGSSRRLVEIEELTISDVVLRPSFWKALGKTEGWGKKKVYKETSIYPIMPEEFIETNPTEHHGVTTELGSLHYQHRFIDAINEGETYEQFFEELLKK